LKRGKREEDERDTEAEEKPCLMPSLPSRQEDEDQRNEPPNAPNEESRARGPELWNMVARSHVFNFVIGPRPH